MKKINLTLLVVALIISMFMWLLNDKKVEASGEGGNTYIRFERIEFKPISEKISDFMLIVQQQKEIEELKNRIIELETELEELKAYNLEEKNPFQYYIDNGTRDFYELTAYTNGYESTQKKKGHPLYGVTASGEKTKENHTIACPKSLDFGTEVYIPKLENVYTCEDRGGAIKGKLIDVFIEDLEEAREFGRKKNIEVYIVEVESD